MDLMARRRMMQTSKGTTVVNLWNMASSQMTVTTAGYRAASKTIDADGTITYTNSSGASTARITLGMSASAMGLVNGVQYTVKVWCLNNDFSSIKGSSINIDSSLYYQIFYGPSPFAYTWVQSNDGIVQIGPLYANNYSNGATFSIRVMVVEGDHIDDYVPYAN